VTETQAAVGDERRTNEGEIPPERMHEEGAMLEKVFDPIESDPMPEKGPVLEAVFNRIAVSPTVPGGRRRAGGERHCAERGGSGESDDALTQHGVPPLIGRARRNAHAGSRAQLGIVLLAGSD